MIENENIDTSKMSPEEIVEFLKEDIRRSSEFVAKRKKELEEKRQAEARIAEAKKVGEQKKTAKKESVKKVSENPERGVPDEFYELKERRHHSIYSYLNKLNRDSDIVKFTNSTIPTILKKIYTPDELQERIKNTNSLNFEDFSRKVLNAYGKKESDVLLCSIADRVKAYKEKKIRWKESVKESEKDNNGIEIVDISGPQALVYYSTSTYGSNPYFLSNKKREKETGIRREVKPLSMYTLFAKFSSEKEAEDKISEINSYIKDTYGYNIQYSAKGNKFKKNTLILEESTKQMDKAVGMLYEVAKTFTGSKKVSRSMAKSMVDLDEIENGYLNSRFFYNGHWSGKMFRQQSDYIKDVVATLTTIFMARFVFEAPQYAQIERDLAQQACYKLKNVQFNSDRNEDYWINSLIQERLKVNIDQVLAYNNIKSANQLVEIYNRNGTVIEKPENINCIDDLIFANQYSILNRVENKLLENVKENIFGSNKAVIKNNKNLVNKATEENIFGDSAENQRLNKLLNNKFVEEIRKSEEYKKYYEDYKKMFGDLQIKYTQEELDQIREQIKKNANENEEVLLSVKNINGLDKDEEKELVRAYAQKDVANEKIDSKLQQASSKAKAEVKEEKQETKTSENKSNTLKLVESFKVNDGKDKDALIGQESIDFDALEATKEENKQNKKTVENFVVNQDKNADALLGQESIDFDALSKSETKEANKEENKGEKAVKEVIYRTEKAVKNLSSEELAKKVKKFYSEIINGSNGKVGVIGENLNYRRVEDENSSNKTSDSKRLDDKELTKANRIRAEKIDEIIEVLTNSTLDYFENNKESLDGTRIPKLCNENIKARFNIDAEKRFTKADLKKCISVMITKLVNEELKDADLELYTGKNTYKKYSEKAEEFLGGE